MVDSTTDIMANTSADRMEVPAVNLDGHSVQSSPHGATQEQDENESQTYARDLEPTDNGSLAAVDYILQLFPTREKYFEHYHDNYDITLRDQDYMSHVVQYLGRFLRHPLLEEMRDVLQARQVLIQHRFKEVPRQFQINHVHWITWLAACEQSATGLQKTRNWLKLRSDDFGPLRDAWEAFWDLVEDNEPHESEAMMGCIERMDRLGSRVRFITDCFLESCSVHNFIFTGEEPQWLEWDYFGWPDLGVSDGEGDADEDLWMVEAALESDVIERESQQPEQEWIASPKALKGKDDVGGALSGDHTHMEATGSPALVSEQAEAVSRGASDKIIGHVTNDDSDMTSRDRVTPSSVDRGVMTGVEEPPNRIEPGLPSWRRAETCESVAGDPLSVPDGISTTPEDPVESVEDDIAALLAAKAQIETQIAQKQALLKARESVTGAYNQHSVSRTSESEVARSEGLFVSERHEVGGSEGFITGAGEGETKQEGGVSHTPIREEDASIKYPVDVEDGLAGESVIATQATEPDTTDQDFGEEGSITRFLYPARRIHWTS